MFKNAEEKQMHQDVFNTWVTIFDHLERRLNIKSNQDNNNDGNGHISDNAIEDSNVQQHEHAEVIGTSTQVFDSFYHNDDGIDLFVDLTDTSNINKFLESSNDNNTTNVHNMIK
jgi:hypothetical protein